MPHCLDRPAVLHTLCALGDGRGRLGVCGKNDKAAERGPGEQGAQEMLDAGNDFFFAALLEVLVGGHEGGEADFGAYLADEGEAIGQGLAVHRGGVGVGAKVLDHGPEAVVGYFEGELAAEGVDARPDVA